jgi:hypothetical protein
MIDAGQRSILFLDVMRQLLEDIMQPDSVDFDPVG